MLATLQPCIVGYLGIREVNISYINCPEVESAEIRLLYGSAGRLSALARLTKLPFPPCLRWEKSGRAVPGVGLSRREGSGRDPSDPVARLARTAFAGGEWAGRPALTPLPGLGRLWLAASTNSARAIAL